VNGGDFKRTGHGGLACAENAAVAFHGARWVERKAFMDIETPYSGAAGLFARSWWVFLLRGLLALFLGFMVFRRPTLTLGVLLLGFAVYAIFEGVSALFAAIRGWSYRRDRWLLLLEAVAGIGVGIMTLHRPGVTAFVLVFFIAIWALATGVLRIAEAVNVGEGPGRGWLAVGGVASIIFALLVLFRPLTGALAIVKVIGIYALILGVTEVVLAFTLRGRRRLDRSGAWRPAEPRPA
jgi:uncharacterized membrane protein HdeD (DUF308 family)